MSEIEKMAVRADALVGVSSMPRIARRAHGADLAPRLFYWMAVAAPLLWISGHLFPPINHDAALILDMAGRWLDGERLYAQIIDVNPPLIFILSALPVLLSRLFGIFDVPTTFVLALAASIAASLLVTRRIIGLAEHGHGPAAQLTLLPLVAFVFAVFPNENFGQREHLMLLGAAPYLMLAALRAQGIEAPRSLAVPVSILAGLLFSLKPHFLLMPALVEAYILYSGRGRNWRDPAVWSLSAGPLLHLFIIQKLTPAYLSDVVPLAFRHYAERPDAMWDVLTGGLIAPTLGILIPLAAIAFWQRSFHLQRVLALFTAAAIVVAVAQGKGWSYQSMPAMAGALLLLGSTVAAFLDRAVKQKGEAGARLTLAGLFLAFCYHEAVLSDPPFRLQRDYAQSEGKQLRTIVERDAFDGKVLILSPGVAPHFPMINYAGVRQATRFESMWLLQGIYAYCHPHMPRYNALDRLSAGERLLFESIARDFTAGRPSLLIVDREAGIPQCNGEDFDYLKYFMRDPDFAATFAQYSLLVAFDRYQIYKLEFPEE